MLTIQCEFCHVEFVAISAKRRFCSKKCAKRSWSGYPKTRKCLQCNKEFDLIDGTSNKRYCSEVCKKIASKTIRSNTKHGLSAYVVNNCRCEVCKKAMSEWSKSNRLKHIEREHNREKQRRERNREKTRQRDRELYKINRERRLQSKKNTYQKYPEVYKKKVSDRYHANLEIYRAKGRVQYQKHIEARKRAACQWRKEHPEKMKEYGYARRSRERGAQGKSSSEQIESRWDYYGGICWMCGKPATTMDHVIPLSKNGTNWPANLRPACAHCNISKGNRDYHVYLAKRNI